LSQITEVPVSNLDDGSPEAAAYFRFELRFRELEHRPRRVRRTELGQICPAGKTQRQISGPDPVGGGEANLRAGKHQTAESLSAVERGGKKFEANPKKDQKQSESCSRVGIYKLKTKLWVGGNQPI